MVKKIIQTAYDGEFNISDMRCRRCQGSLTKHTTRILADGSLRQRYLCRDCGKSQSYPDVGNPDEILRTDFRDELPRRERYVVTCAQNATGIKESFFKALQLYCSEKDAELVILPLRYRNPTSRWTNNDEDDDWWWKDLKPFMFAGRQILCPSLVVMGDIKVQCTASRPLTSFETITGDLSGIIGHPKLELKTIATPQNELPKIMTTTGAVTIKNYTDTKAGKRGEFHHTYGACVVEISGRGFHMRQINAKADGSFIDMERRYTSTKSMKAPPAEAIVFGDIHRRFVDPAVVRATWTGPKALVKRLKPKYWVWHDILDFHSGSHWHRNDPFVAAIKRRTGMDDVRKELRETIEFIDEMSKGGNHTNVLVASNHDEHLLRWLRETDWRKDPSNAEFYLETALETVRGSTMEKWGHLIPDPFIRFAKEFLKYKKTLFLTRFDSFVRKVVEMAMHGDLGPNGSRGFTRALARIGVKLIICHSHSSEICEGLYRGGTSSYLRLSYVRGPSSWLQTHVLLYGNGKRTLINIIDGEVGNE